MEATATASTTGSATGSQTIADLIPCAAAAHGENTAIRYKRDGAWHDVNYAQLAQIVQEIGLGLIDLGVEPHEKLCILGNTRPEWSYADMAATSAGAVVVPIYQTNSPEECLWVISDSDASAIVCENQEQLEKIAAIRDQVPNLRTIIVIDPPESGGIASGPSEAVQALQAISLDEVRERGRSRNLQELEARREGVRGEDPFTFIYTSGTTGPPKGCVLTHGNYRAIIDMVGEAGEIRGDAAISRVAHGCDHVAPQERPGRLAVDEHDRGSLALVDVCQPQPVELPVLRLVRKPRDMREGLVGGADDRFHVVKLPLGNQPVSSSRTVHERLRGVRGDRDLDHAGEPRQQGAARRCR